MPHKPYTTRRNNKHLRDLNGTWHLSKTASTGVPPALALQGLNPQTRRAFIASPFQLWISQNNYPSQIFVKQFPTASSLPEQTEKFYPPQRLGKWSEWSHQRSGVLGDTKSRCRWSRNSRISEEIEDSSDGRSSAATTSSGTASMSLDPIVEEFLMEGVSQNEFLEVEVESLEAGWTAKQVWTMDGFGRLVRRVVTWGREGKRAETRLVYEFDG